MQSEQRYRSPEIMLALLFNLLFSLAQQHTCEPVLLPSIEYAYACRTLLPPLQEITAASATRDYSKPSPGIWMQALLVLTYFSVKLPRTPTQAAWELGDGQ